jgi:hypothetical protein
MVEEVGKMTRQHRIALQPKIDKDNKASILKLEDRPVY